MGVSGWAAFRIGYVAGLANFLAGLYWLLLIPVAWAPIVGWLLLSGYCALFAGGWVWICWRIFPRSTEESGALNEAGSVSTALDKFASVGWPQRAAWAFACAALWVCWEMIQGRLFTGFPWNFLATSQYKMLPLIQVSAWTGIYGVSFLVVWFSASLLGAGVMIARRKGSAWTWGQEFAVPLLVVVGVSAYGLQHILHAPEPAARVKILMVQPSIPQTAIWDSNESASRFAQLMELSERGLTNEQDLMLWPEAAVPSLFRFDTNIIYNGKTVYHAIMDLVKRHKTWLIMGADDAEPRAGAREGADFYNSSFLVSPEGRLVEKYHKQMLVIFGEYVPLRRWFPFLMDFVKVYGEFTPGKGPIPFRISELRIKASVLICFEDVFPHVARKHVDKDTDFLVNLTNNGWFGESAAQWQHAASSVFRAVENGVPLVRDTNNGLTCWVDAYGGLHDVEYPGFKDIYQAGVKVSHVPILAGQQRALTFYTRNGDVFGWSCVGLGGVLLGWVLFAAISRKMRA